MANVSNTSTAITKKSKIPILFFFLATVAFCCNGSTFHPSLEQTRVRNLLHDFIGKQQYKDIRNIIEQTNSRRVAVLSPNQANIVHIGGDNLRGVQVQVILQQEYL